jgi:hypothetical protein
MDRMHTPSTSTETGAPEVAVAGDENDGKKKEHAGSSERRRLCVRWAGASSAARAICLDGRTLLHIIIE